MGSLIKRTALVAIFMVGVSAPALAATCTEPVPPVIAVNGVTATVQQMKDAIADFKTYQSAADDFQSCISVEIQKKEAAAKKSSSHKPIDPAILSALNSRAKAVQAEKEKRGGQLNAQIVAFKQAHPGQ